MSTEKSICRKPSSQNDEPIKVAVKQANRNMLLIIIVVYIVYGFITDMCGKMHLYIHIDPIILARGLLME
jgi:hypothetical protein